MDRVNQLIEQLNSPTVLDRITAAQALGRLGREAAAALRPLLDRYAETEDHAEREAVALAISQINPGALPGAMLVRTVQQDRKSARAWARALGESQALARARDVLWAMDDGAPELEPLEPFRELVALLVEDPGLLPEFMERHAASMPPGDLAEVLYLAGQKLSKAHKVLEALQHHPDAEVAAAAGRMCRRIEAESALTDEGQQLVALAAEHPAVTPVLIEAFVNRPRLRRRLAVVLEFLVRERPEVVDELRPLLRSGAEVAQLAAEALSSATVDGPRARALAEALLSLYDRPDRDRLEWDTPQTELAALGRGPAGPEIVEAIMAKLRAAPSSIPLIEVLADMARESPAGPGSEALLRLMTEEGGLIRAGALRAGGSLRDERVTSACCGALRDADVEVRSAAAAAMTCWAADRLAGVQQELLRGLGDNCLEVAEAVAYCFGKVGPAALPALRARLEEAQAELDGLLAHVRPDGEAAEADQVRRARLSVCRYQDAIEKIERPGAP
jgi:HEAT repeat protein